MTGRKVDFYINPSARHSLSIINFYNTSNRTFLGAKSAADALLVIDDGVIIHDVNRFLGAYLDALAAADTAVGAYLASDSALVLV